MEREPHVSISLSTFNEGPFVARTVEAILTGTEYRSFDILVHDDGSTDGSCRGLLNDPRVKVFRSESRHGVAGGKKIAVEACRGPLLLSMDCHVAPSEPGWLRRLVEVLHELDHRAILSPVSVPLDGEKWRLKSEKRPVLTRLRNTFQVSWWKAIESTEPWIEVSSLRGIAKLMTWEVYEAMGGFDDALMYGGEEADVSVRAWMSGFTCAYVPSSVIGHVYKRKSQFPRSYKEETVNRLRVAYKCLSDEGYKRVVKHNQVLLKEAGGWGFKVFEEAIAAVEERYQEFEIARQAVRSRAVCPGDWVLERFAIDL